jgi:hypothetical protein
LGEEPLDDREALLTQLVQIAVRDLHGRDGNPAPDFPGMDPDVLAGVSVGRIRAPDGQVRGTSMTGRNMDLTSIS